MNWQEVKTEFEWDGSWRDIYVLDTGLEAWQKLLDFLRSSRYQVFYTDEGEAASLPETAAEVLQERGSASSYLGVEAGGLLFNCHFFTDEQVEFDLDPREVKGQDTLDVVLAFMRDIGQALGKRVILTPENCQEIAIFEYLPESNSIRHMPFGGWS